ncbi:MAG: YIP1 family protein [Anaerolineaceae bacterium]
MAETVRESQNTTPRSMHWNWIPAIFIKPRQTITKILAEEKPVWLTPLLIISILVALSVLVSAPIQRVITQSGADMPENFEYWTQDEQNAFLQAQANQTSPLFLYIFPFVERLAGYWLIWFLFSSILHLSITLSGSRANRQKTSNLAAWTMIPFALRLLVEIVVMLTTKRLVEFPGLSSLMPSEVAGFNIYLKGILSAIDIYYVFHIILMLIGAVPLSGLSKSKATTATLIAVLIMLLLQALPGWVVSLFSGLSGTGGFYF